MIQVEVADDRLVFHAPNLMKDILRQVPGMKWHRATDTWRTLSWSVRSSCPCQSWERQAGAAPLRCGSGGARAAWRSASLNLKALPWAAGEYGFQENGFAWLQMVGKGVLGDEPGLGKSRQAVLAATFPCLVICPNTLKLNWKKEFEKWRSDLTVTVLNGSYAARVKQLSTDSQVFVTNWESIRTMSRLAPYGSLALTEKEKTPGPLNRPWASVIADEVHAAKDPKSKQTRAYWAIMSTAERRYGLTGTLAPESPDDVWGPSCTVCAQRRILPEFSSWIATRSQPKPSGEGSTS